MEVEPQERKHNMNPYLENVPPLEVLGDGEQPPPKVSDEQMAKALALQLAAEEEARQAHLKALEQQSEELLKSEIRKEQLYEPLDANDPFWREKRAQMMAAAGSDQEAAGIYIQAKPDAPLQLRQNRHPRIVQNDQRGGDGVFFRDEPHLPELWGPGMAGREDGGVQERFPKEHGEAWKQRRAVAMVNADNDDDAADIYLKMRQDAEGRKKDAVLEQQQIQNLLDRNEVEAVDHNPAEHNPAVVPGDLDDAKLDEQRAKAMANADNDEQAARIYIGMKDMALGKDRDPVDQQRLAELQIERKKIWVCRLCTLHNPVSKTKCMTCHTKRKGEKSQFKKWKCSECTLDNDATVSVCSACGKPHV